jgi:hypothetical protein
MQGARSGFRGFSVRTGMGLSLRAADRRVCACLPKIAMQRSVCLPLVGALFFVFLCALGLKDNAQAQVPLPTVTNVNPNTGPPVGGTSVTISGTNFFGVTVVLFGRNAAVSFTVKSETQITATSPAGIGTIDITVTTERGTSPINLADRFTYAAVPTVSNVSRPPTDSIKLHGMQVSVTPMIGQIAGQAVIGAIGVAIDAGFSGSLQTLAPNGAGFSFQTPLGQSAAGPTRGGGNGTERSVPIGAGTPGNGTQGAVGVGPGSLANGRYGGNGAPAGTRLIDMPVIPLPPGSGMPPIGETRFSPDLLMLQFAFGTTLEQISTIALRFGLTPVAQQTIGMLGRTVYIFRIANGQSVREMIRSIEAAGLPVVVQPHYTYRLTQDHNNPNAGLGDPAQYIVNKFHLAEVHRITKGEKAVVAVIDSEIDSSQPNLVGTVSDRYDAGCDASSPHPHGTGMAGAIASHGQLLGVAPQANIIAICAFGGAGQPEGSSFKVIKGLDHAVQRGARIINMSFAGPRDPALAQALQIAREKGILVIAAAGNNGPNSSPVYPGADPNVMAVTATDESDRLFNRANQGRYITVAAPGVDILVPAPNGGVQFTTGTSVATANVSGVAALLIAQKPSLTPGEIRAILVRTAKHLGSRGINPQFGAGLVDPLEALGLLMAYTPEENDVRHFLASPASSRYVEDGFTALGYARDDPLVTKTMTPVAAPSRDWIAWIDVRSTDFNRNTFGSDLRGTQVNAIAGLTRKFTPNFLVGVLGGYEHFDYSSQAFNGVLKGEGWTTGGYLGWRLNSSLRFDAGGTWSDILANDAAGIASGNFIGHRWLATGGLTGTYGWRAVVLEPSARVFALWEHENAYTDSLGTPQIASNFATGRASGGVKVSYPWAGSSTTNLAPYMGLYGDYYFSRNDATTVGQTTVPLLQGWSGRVTAGMAMTFGHGEVSAGGEYGGIGSDNRIWTWRVRGGLAF